MAKNKELEKAQQTWESFTVFAKWSTIASVIVIAIIFLIIY